MHISNKKGQSIVEVMVSLMLLAVALSGSISLILNVVNLALEARTKTKVVSFAQSRLANTVSGATSGCFVGIAAGARFDYPDESAGSNIYSTSTIAPDSDFAGLQKVVVEVVWTPKRGGTQTYTLAQLIRTVDD